MNRIFRIILTAIALSAAITMAGCNVEDNPLIYRNDSSTVESSEADKTTTAATTSEKEYKKENNNNNYDEPDNDGFYCMGKNDTCTNKTYDASDLYCHSCDPDNNNIEGDQSDGVIGDNDFDNDIDEDDWETEWGNYLDDKFDDYDYGYDDYGYDYGYDDYGYGFGY